MFIVKFFEVVNYFTGFSKGFPAVQGKSKQFKDCMRLVLIMQSKVSETSASLNKGIQIKTG